MTKSYRPVRPTRTALERANGQQGDTAAIRGQVIVWCQRCRHTFAGVGKKALGGHCRTPGCKGRLSWKPAE